MRVPSVLASVAIPLLAALSGCGGDAPGSCKVATAVDLPLLNRPGIPTVVGRFRDQPVALLLDTGAEQSMVTPSAVERFGLPSDPDHTQIMTGIGGTAMTRFASIHELGLGHGHARDFDLPIGPDLGGHVQNLPTLGLFGADFMSDYDVDFDLPHHHFGMYDLAGCGDAIQPVAAPYFALPFQLSDAHIEIEIRLNGVPVDAMLDSGTATTFVTAADARRAGITPDMLAADRVVHPRGADGFPVEGRLHRFTSVELGAERLRNFSLQIASSAVGITLLGDDFFRLNRIWISYPRRMLFIQPAFDNPVVHMVAAATP